MQHSVMSHQRKHLKFNGSQHELIDRCGISVSQRIAVCSKLQSRPIFPVCLPGSYQHKQHKEATYGAESVVLPKHLRPLVFDQVLFAQFKVFYVVFCQEHLYVRYTDPRFCVLLFVCWSFSFLWRCNSKMYIQSLTYFENRCILSKTTQEPLYLFILSCLIVISLNATRSQILFGICTFFIQTF